MGEESEPEPEDTFGKFLSDFDDSTFLLTRRVPKNFMKNHKEKLSENVKLCAESGASWNLKIEKIEGEYFFTDGWKEFAEGVDLKSKDYMWFTLVEKSKFEVWIDDVTTCPKELPFCPRTSNEQADYNTTCVNRVPRTRSFMRKLMHDVTGFPKELLYRPGTSNEQADRNISRVNRVPRTKSFKKLEVESGRDKEHAIDLTDDYDHDGKCWRFDMILTKQHESELEIPREFALDTGIALNRKPKLVVHGKKKKSSMHVTTKKCGKFAFTAGWNDFLLENKIVVGSTMNFTFIPNSEILIETQVLKRGTKGELFSSAKQGRGRPAS